MPDTPPVSPPTVQPRAPLQDSQVQGEAQFRNWSACCCSASLVSLPRFDCESQLEQDANCASYTGLVHNDQPAVQTLATTAALSFESRVGFAKASPSHNHFNADLCAEFWLMIDGVMVGKVAHVGLHSLDHIKMKLYLLL